MEPGSSQMGPWKRLWFPAAAEQMVGVEEGGALAPDHGPHLPKTALGCWNTLSPAGQGDQRCFNGSWRDKQALLETCPWTGSLSLGAVDTGAGGSVMRAGHRPVQHCEVLRSVLGLCPLAASSTAALGVGRTCLQRSPSGPGHKPAARTSD